MVREERERLLITFYNKTSKKYSKGNVYFVVHVDVRLKKKKKKKVYTIFNIQNEKRQRHTYPSVDCVLITNIILFKLHSSLHTTILLLNTTNIIRFIQISLARSFLSHCRPFLSTGSILKGVGVCGGGVYTRPVLFGFPWEFMGKDKEMRHGCSFHTTNFFFFTFFFYEKKTVLQKTHTSSTFLWCLGVWLCDFSSRYHDNQSFTCK